MAAYILESSHWSLIAVFRASRRSSRLVEATSGTVMMRMFASLRSGTRSTFWRPVKILLGSVPQPRSLVPPRISTQS